MRLRSACLAPWLAPLCLPAAAALCLAAAVAVLPAGAAAAALGSAPAGRDSAHPGAGVVAPVAEATADSPARRALEAAWRSAQDEDLAGYASGLESAATAARGAGDRETFSLALAERARLLSALGAYQSAARLIAQAQDPQTSPLARAQVLLERSRLEVARGRLDAAGRTLSDAARLAESTGAQPPEAARAGPSAPNPGGGTRLSLTILENEARLAAQRNHADEAAAMCRALLVRARDAKAPDVACRAWVLLGRQSLHDRDAEGARAAAEQALKLAAAGGVPQSEQLEAVLLRGLSYLFQGRLDEARGDLALARRQARSEGQGVAEAAAEEGLGDADARAHLSDSAYRWYSLAEASLARAETSRWQTPFNPGPTWLGPRALLRRRLNLALWDRSPQRAWKIQEDDRTGALLRALSGSATNRLPLWEPAEIEGARALAARRAALRSRGDLADSDWEPLIRATDSLQQSVKARFLEAYHLEPGDPERVRSELGEDEALVGYFLTPGIPCAWILDRDSLTLVPLGSGREMDQAISALLGAASGRRAFSRGRPAMDADSAAAFLEAKLREPVARRLPLAARRVVLVPDGQLMYTPAFLPGLDPTADSTWEVSWAASAGTWLRFRHSRGGGSDGGGWRVAPAPEGPARQQQADYWRRLLGAGGRLLASRGLDVPSFLREASGASLLIYLPGVRVSDRRPEQSELIAPGAASQDTSWLDVRSLARSHLEASVLVAPQQSELAEREGSGLGSLGLACAALEAGSQRVALQIAGSHGELLDAWIGAFHSGLRAGASPARAAAAATRALRERSPDLPAGDIPVFALFGASREAMTFPVKPLVEPWVLGLILISAALAVISGAIMLLRRRARQHV